MVIRGRPYNFFRGLDGDLKPAYAWSDDGGLTWHTGNRIIPSPSLRPYVKYASNGTNTIHLIYTEGHPGEFGKTSVFHVYYRNGRLHRSDWQSAVIAHLRRLREQLPGAVIVMTQFQAMKNYPAFDAAIAAIAAREPDVVAVDSTGAALRDGNHWSCAGFKTLARRMAAATVTALDSPGHSSRKEHP